MEEMRHFRSSWPPALGKLVGTLPLATVLRTEAAEIRIGSIDVYEGAAQMLMTLTLAERVEPPKVRVPAEFRDQMQGAMVRQRISSDIVGDGADPSVDTPINYEIPHEQPAHLEIRIRVTDDRDAWLHSMPRGINNDTRTYRGEFEFVGDLRELGANPRLMIEPYTWRSMFELPDYKNVPPFEPKWSIPIDLNSLVPAKEIDAR